MQMQLKVIQGGQKKGKSSSGCQTTTDELQYLIDAEHQFSNGQDYATHVRTFFISIVNVTLVRRDSYLDHLRSNIKQDTFNVLRTAPLHLATLFQDSVLKTEEHSIV